MLSGTTAGGDDALRDDGTVRDVRGAIVHARIERVVFGVADERWGGAGSVFNVLGSGRLNHRPVVEGGVLARESARLLLDFFRARRVSGNRPNRR